MRGYEGKDPDDVTAMFGIAYDVAIRRCAFASAAAKRRSRKRSALRIRFGGRSTRRRTCSRSATPATTPVAVSRCRLGRGDPLAAFRAPGGLTRAWRVAAQRPALARPRTAAGDPGKGETAAAAICGPAPGYRRPTPRRDRGDAARGVARLRLARTAKAI
jgi:hypothetical protein